MKPWALIIAGPTCSGKSALAFHVAQRLKGTIINADSMQVYKELRVLTARPIPQEEAEIPHELYGCLPASQAGSVAWWRSQALAALDTAIQQQRLPILCGGTGLYFNALVKGLASIPDPTPEVRLQSRALLQAEGSEGLYRQLERVDPQAAQRLHPSDGQRLARAWEVWKSTGRSITEWQSIPGLPPAPYRFMAIRLAPSRPVLRERIEARFAAMLDHGAVDEVKALLAQQLDPALPAMRAHGVPELIRFLSADCSLEQASQLAVQATVRYTKRQATWFAHHDLAEQGRYEIFAWNSSKNEQQMENMYNNSISFIIKMIDE
ncbi:tRNA (adenosine(37)-N6)-dimethylallyltransferase MiaA [Entomobacter blattae]|uniref:tRNA (adenosine(37)-N6)-dimethylallyltransferase MiaA n=1 Tax=Entomobacter blattae TaxID=2762277 RepID=UPI00193BD216|nr:tRNA (adenosine(37)-N6)-dimethylallyltransferase MiaA [Entomobacter blattae]